MDDFQGNGRKLGYDAEISGPSAAELQDSREYECSLPDADHELGFGLHHKLLTPEEVFEAATRMKGERLSFNKQVAPIRIAALRGADFGIALSRPNEFHRHAKHFSDALSARSKMPDAAYRIYELAAANAALSEGYDGRSGEFKYQRQITRNSEEAAAILLDCNPSSRFFSERLEGDPFYPGLMAYRDKVLQLEDRMKANGEFKKDALQRLSLIAQDLSFTPNAAVHMINQAEKLYLAYAQDINYLATHNQKLVASIAFKHLNSARSKGSILDIKDLISYGNIGLLKALEKYEPERGFKLSTYAIWWIRQSIMRGIADTRSGIRLPVHVQAHNNEIGRAISRLKTQFGGAYQPTQEEIADEMGVDMDWLERHNRNTRQVVSLDTVCGEDDDTTLMSFVADESAESPSAKADVSITSNKLQVAMSSLTERERKILTLRFGLGGGGERTLEEIGEEYGITRERIRQIEVKALKKLRHPTRSKHLEGLL
jgi:RNA polymerase sigma factor (sigma-70 family)